MWYFGRMGPHWRVPAGNYQIPGLFVPRTDERPYHCNGVSEDSYGRAFVDNDRGDLTLYAESDDGVNWVKPNLGIFTFNGSPDNNIIWDLHGASVFVDREEEDLDKRYKAIGFCRRYRGIFLLTSPDGIHWDDSDRLQPVVRRSNEGTFNVTWDAVDSVYRAYSIQRYDDVHKRRVICYSESPLWPVRGRIPARFWSRATGTMRSPIESTARCGLSFTTCRPFVITTSIWVCWVSCM